jgi:hypothetical protein
LLSEVLLPLFWEPDDVQKFFLGNTLNEAIMVCDGLSTPDPEAQVSFIVGESYQIYPQNFTHLTKLAL